MDEAIVNDRVAAAGRQQCRL